MMHMAKIHGLCQFFPAEIISIRPGAERFAAQIDGIGAGIHRRFQRFPGTGRGEQFNLFLHTIPLSTLIVRL